MVHTIENQYKFIFNSPRRFLLLFPRSHLVNCVRIELSQTLSQFLSENIDHESAANLVLTVLGSAMALLRRCRVNAALTIQLFSQLFHYINVISFNTVRSIYIIIYIYHIFIYFYCVVATTILLLLLIYSLSVHNE